MPVKTHKTSHKKHPKHYVKVYWPYLPLILIVGLALWLSYPSVARSQRDVLSYTTNVNAGELLQATNQQRHNNDKPSLEINPQLNNAAQAKAEDMAARNYWSHTTPDGLTPWHFIDQAGYQYDKAAENLAYGFSNSTEAVRGWLNSPEHRANLLDQDYAHVGFGITQSQDYQGNGSETIVVALYGKPAQNTHHNAVLGETSQGGWQEVTRNISKAQALTSGRIPWIGFILGVLVGGAIIYLFIKHSVSIHKTIRKGEKFVLKHPVWDVTALAVIALCIILSQSVGVIR